MTAGDRILVVKLADLGDAVLALPAVQALRDAYPESRIDILTTSAGANVFRLSPAVDEIITLAKQRFDQVKGLISPGGLFDLARFAVRLRRSRYDSIILLHHLTTEFGTSKFRALANATGASIVAGLDNGRGGFLTHRATDYGFGRRTEWEYSLEIVATLGAGSAPQRPMIDVPDVARQSVRQIRERYGLGDRYAVVHAEVGEYSPARAWPIKRFGEVASELIHRHDMPVALVGVEPELPEYRELDRIRGLINLAGRTSFEELCGLVEGASLVVGCDSAVSHLAGAFDRPLVTLFGPSNIAAWKPYGAKEQILGEDTLDGARQLALHLDLPCSPCLYTGFRLGRPEGCSTRTCLMAMSEGSVASAVSSVAEQVDRRNPPGQAEATSRPDREN